MSKNYFADFNSIDSKLVELLEDHQLIRKFNTDGYPITLTISLNVSPEAQMTMYAMAEDGASSRDAKLIFTFPVGEIGVKVSGRLVISDSLMNKIKGYAKKMHYLYLQGEYALRSEEIRPARLCSEDATEDDEDLADECDAADMDGDTEGGEFADFFGDEGGEAQEEE